LGRLKNVKLYNMNKKSVLIAILLVSGVVFGVSRIIPAKEKDVDVKVFLKEAGFNKIPELRSYSVDVNKKYWLNKYGLYFVTLKEMDSLLLLNNFIIGASQFYKESIPDAAAKEMAVNYKKIKNDVPAYYIDPTSGLGSNYTTAFTEDEVGWWMSGKLNDDSYDYTLISRKLEKRLTKKGRKTLRDVYRISGAHSWNMQYRKPVIEVVADKSKFDTTGMVIVNNHLLRPEPPRRDPIAVVRHREGYIILARWD
jgi:hypothetical protein